VLGAVWLPTDGWLDPSNLAFALAAGARGARSSTTTASSIGVREGG
jgi:4-methylaminobutanoate oxidase (formaldehyde-forming)